jgi:hypothetical protein
MRLSLFIFVTSKRGKVFHAAAAASARLQKLDQFALLNIFPFIILFN